MVQIGASHFVRDVPTSDMADILEHPDSFRLLYFPLEGLGQTSRDILAYGEAKWESLFPGKWSEDKGQTPFGCLPVLFVNKNGKEAVLSEAPVIETYLAKHFGLLGENQYEESLIKASHNSSQSVMNFYSTSVAYNMPEVQEKTRASFLDYTLPNWIATHERHLVDNGSNGHYLGDKLSLADIKTANVIDHFAHQQKDQEIIEKIKKSPALWKVKETVDAKLAKWRASDDFKTLATSTTAFYLDPMAAIAAM
ncbi:hypothetical protein BGX27_004013 [Mortierella sp. AM989]|nr:hypothetical protein BGX27_004013 [Mortierella sp. AM989]